MNGHDFIEIYGLIPKRQHLEAIRILLRLEVEKETREQGEGDTELMKLFCIQLFSAGILKDVALIWAAKTASMDASAAIDVQLLCGAGLEETKESLANCNSEWAQNALAYITKCENAGDFCDFNIATQMNFYSEYFE